MIEGSSGAGTALDGDAGTVHQPFRVPLIAVPSGEPTRESDNVKRARAWEERHPGSRIVLAGKGGGFAAVDVDGETLGSGSSMGALMDVLEDAEAEADEADLATLRRWFGHAWSITYDADVHGGGRWDARPLCNVGRDGEAVTASAAALLAAKLARAEGL